MIEFKKLRKVYNSQKGGKCVALKDIDLKLPDTGLVFIIGKSGSGKSTLLNLLGGLDTITQGDIIADGNSLASFSKSDFEKYRSSYIGFVFQHYYLLDELTVKQNIELAMGIVGKKDKKRVTELLAKVGLEGCEGRYPKELSGGQQQRVAIARALAKDPMLILGDELTGNLDHNTSVEILNVLKEISKEKLVIVVSHNLDEADQFADRIIELHDGKIFRDRVRVTNRQKKFMIKGRIAYLPYFRDLTPEETKILNQGLRSGRICDVVQQDDGFVMTTEVQGSDRRVELKKKRFVGKNKAQYTGIFTVKGAVSKAITIAIVTLMILCVSVFSSIHKIQHSEIRYEKTEEYLSVVKGGLEAPSTGLFSSYFYRVLDDEIALAEELSGDKVYKLVNPTLLTYHDNSDTGAGFRSDIKRNMRGFYTVETYGTLICDEEFLAGKYGGESGELSLRAGSLDKAYSSCGMIITDYIADSFIKNGTCSSDASIIKNGYAVAIINTGYEERYQSIIEEYKAYSGDYEDLYYSLCETTLFREFLNELIYSLGVTYTFNENFAQDYINATDDLFLRNITFEKDGVTYPGNMPTRENIASNDFLSNGEIVMGFANYNSIFGTGYTAENYTDFVPHEITLRIYDKNDGEKILLEERTFTIVGLDTSRYVQMNRNDKSELKKYHVQVFGLYVKNNENVDNVISELADHYMSVRDIGFEAVAGINKIMSVFVPLFKLIAAGLYIFIVVYLINHAIQTIKKNYFQIGVMRSFGAKNFDVGIIFITGVVLTGILISVLSVVFEPYIVGLYNKILVESFSLVIGTYAFDLQIINMSPWLPIFNSALVIVITLVSALISLLVLRNLKPIEIIRAKDNGGEVS